MSESVSGASSNKKPNSVENFWQRNVKTSESGCQITKPLALLELKELTRDRKSRLCKDLSFSLLASSQCSIKTPFEAAARVRDLAGLLDIFDFSPPPSRYKHRLSQSLISLDLSDHALELTFPVKTATPIVPLRSMTNR